MFGLVVTTPPLGVAGVDAGGAPGWVTLWLLPVPPLSPAAAIQVADTTERQSANPTTDDDFRIDIILFWDRA